MEGKTERGREELHVPLSSLRKFLAANQVRAS